MSWQNSLTAIVRVLIGDTDTSNPKFTDNRIQQSLVVAASYVMQDYQGGTTYTLDFENVTITPDPMGDAIMIALIPLKAACLFMTEIYSKAALNSVKIREGDSGIENTVSPIIRDLMPFGPCKKYDELLDLLLRRKIRGKAIASPFTSSITDTGLGGEGIWAIRGFYNSFLSWG